MDSEAAFKPRARSRGEKEKKRRILLDTALALFNEYDYRGTSIESITEQAGVSTGTFYLYFRNKLEIYRILNAEGNDILARLIEEAPASPEMTATAKLTAIADAYYGYYTEYPGYFRISSVQNIGQADFQKKTEMQAHLNRQAEGIFERIETVLKEGIRDGEFTEMNTRQVTMTLWGMLDGMFILAEREQQNMINGNFDDLFKQGLDILLYGLVSQPVDEG